MDSSILPPLQRLALAPTPTAPPAEQKRQLGRMERAEEAKPYARPPAPAPAPASVVSKPTPETLVVCYTELFVPDGPRRKMVVPRKAALRKSEFLEDLAGDVSDLGEVECAVRVPMSPSAARYAQEYLQWCEAAARRGEPDNDLGFLEEKYGAMWILLEASGVLGFKDLLERIEAHFSMSFVVLARQQLALTLADVPGRWEREMSSFDPFTPLGYPVEDFRANLPRILEQPVRTVMQTPPIVHSDVVEKLLEDAIQLAFRHGMDFDMKQPRDYQNQRTPLRESEQKRAFRDMVGTMDGLVKVAEGLFFHTRTRLFAIELECFKPTEQSENAGFWKKLCEAIGAWERCEVTAGMALVASASEWPRSRPTWRQTFFYFMHYINAVPLWRPFLSGRDVSSDQVAIFSCRTGPGALGNEVDKRPKLVKHAADKNGFWYWYRWLRIVSEEKWQETHIASTELKRRCLVETAVAWDEELRDREEAATPPPVGHRYEDLHSSKPLLGPAPWIRPPTQTIQRLCMRPEDPPESLEVSFKTLAMQYAQVDVEFWIEWQWHPETVDVHEWLQRGVVPFVPNLYPWWRRNPRYESPPPIVLRYEGNKATNHDEIWGTTASRLAAWMVKQEQGLPPPYDTPGPIQHGFDLILGGADVNDTSQDLGIPLLALAATIKSGWTTEERLEMMKELLASRADIEAKTLRRVSRWRNGADVDPGGHTALSLACYSGSEETIRFLLNAGASPETTGNDGMNCLEMAAAGNAAGNDGFDRLEMARSVFAEFGIMSEVEEGF